MNKDELLRRYAAGERNFSGVVLRDADLSGANLERVIFDGADLSNTNLVDANLDSADLSNADLTNANLSGANLYCSKMYGANFTNANLSNANLTSIIFDGANLTFAHMTNAENLTGSGRNAIYYNTIMPDGTIETVPHHAFLREMWEWEQKELLLERSKKIHET